MLKLIYMWIGQFRNIHNMGLNFDPHFYVEFVSNSSKSMLSITPMRRPSLFDGRINNVSLLVGKNGSGKSNILDLIGHRINERRKLHQPGDSYFVLYHHGANIFCIEGYHFETIRELVDDYPDDPSGFPVVTEPFSMKVRVDTTGRLQFMRFLQFDSVHHLLNVFNIRNEFPDEYNFESFSIRRDTSVFFHRWNVDSTNVGHSAKYKLLVGLKRSRDKNTESIFQNVNGVKIQVKNALDPVRFDQIQLKYRYDVSSRINNLFTQHHGLGDTLTASDNKQAFQLNLIQNYFDFLAKHLRGNKRSHAQANISKLTYVSGDEINYLLSGIKILLRSHDKSDYELYYQAFEELFTKLRELDGDYFTSYKTIEIPVGNTEFPSITSLLSHLDRCRVNESRTDYLKGCIKVVFRPLSSGEESFLDLFASVFFASNFVSPNDARKNALILLDEPDQHMHPEWTRRFLYELVQMLNDLEPYRSYQLIISTHSPFLASDLPRHSIIALSKDGDGNCSIQPFGETFGSNIHTLLIDSFFMESTTGEFALSKINQVIQRLRDTYPLTSTEYDQIREVVLMIGEPILRSKLLEKIDQTHPDYRRKDLLRQISKLNDELKRLEDDDGSNNT